jgi:aminopeptidase N
MSKASFSSIIYAAFFILFMVDISAQDDVICKDFSDLVTMEMNNGKNHLFNRSEADYLDYDIKYHRLEWQVDPNYSYIKGKITTYFEVLENDFSEIQFDLAYNMIINGIGYHDENLNFTLENDVLKINLPASLSSGTLDSLFIDYEGAPTNAGFGSFAIGTHADGPALWTLSEPYGAKYWWPCKQDLNDKIDSIDIKVTTSSKYSVASNGLLKEILATNDSTNVYVWKHRYPIPAYLIAIAVTNFETFSDYVYLDNGDSIEILNYVYPSSLAQAKENLKNTIGPMELFNHLFGTYPFADEKYGHAQFGWGGGMEHQTMSFMGNFSYGLQAHELAHQWFGDKVTCRSWADIWLNEGFATYLTGLTNEFLKTEDDWNNWKTGQINSIVSQPNGSVYVDDTTNVSRIFNGRLSYNKGSYLLHMLRWNIGDENFFQACKNYLNDPLLAFSYANTSDLKFHLEQQSGEDLTEFFDDWFYGQGYPTFTLKWNQTSDILYLRLSQSSSDQSVEFFETPIELRLIGADRDSLIRIYSDIQNQYYDIPVDFEVVNIEFDPNRWIISKDNVVINDMTVNTSNNTGIDELIKIYPIPVGDKLTFELLGDVEAVFLTDLDGKVISNINVSIGENTINTSNLQAGHYFILIKNKGKTISKKIIKH